MLKFYSCYSKAVNPVKAVKESITKVTVENGIGADLIILHSTVGYKLNKLLDAIKKDHPNAKVVGCTGSGVISNGWVSESMRALAAMVVSGDEFVISTVSGVTVENSSELAAKCASDVKSKSSAINMLMAFAPGVVVNADGVISGIDSIFGPEVPILGGTSGFGGADPQTPIFSDGEVLEQSIVIVGFTDPTLEVIQSCHHGYLPQRDYSFEVTKVQGNQVFELNGKPAWPTLMESFKLDQNTSALDLIPILALGVELSETEQEEYDNECLLRAPLIVSEDLQSFIFPAPLPEGTIIVSCQRDEKYLFEGMDGIPVRLLKQLGDCEPVAVFQMDCMARGRLTTGLIEKDEIIGSLQDQVFKNKEIPWLGDYGFGEFAQLGGINRFHNYTTSLSMLVRKL